jgi:hypothetical protein
MTGDPFAVRVDRWLQRHVVTTVALLAATCLVIVVTASRTRPFWHDEIYTILMSRLPSLREMWRASLAGVDLAPPLNLWLTRGVHAVADVGPVATRMPALLGFLMTVFAVFAILMRRAGPTAALTGALLPFMTAGLRYASEARAYGMMMGLAAISLYCWMEAAQGRHRARNLVALSIALAASVWNHYFGVLVFAPVVAGELARVTRIRQADRGVAAAVGIAGLACLPLYPLAAAAGGQRLTFWSNASPRQAFDVYAFVLNALVSWPVALALAVALALCFANGFPRRIRQADDDVRRDPAAEIRRVPLHEAVALIVSVASPLLAVVLGGLTTAFVPRYALGSVPGICVAIPLLLWRFNTRRGLAELALCATLLYFAAASVAASIGRVDAPAVNPVLERPLLVQSLRSPSPTVVSSSLQFLQLWYYADADLKPRMRYLADPAEALKRTGSDTLDRGYLALAERTAVPVLGYDAFVTAHPTFRVYQAGSGWLLEKLAETGATVEEIGAEGGARLYRVTMPAGR